MKVTNINYKGYIVNDYKISKYLKETKNTPHKFIYTDPVHGYKILIFKSKKIRIMKCKELPKNLPFNIKIKSIQSISAIHSIGKSINLIKLNNMYKEITIFEPEIFPAVRFTCFNKNCVNVFRTGKITILGIKNFSEGKNICNKLDDLLKNVNDYDDDYNK